MRLIDIDPIIERLKNAIYLGKRIGEDTANMEAVLADVEAAPTYNDDLISRQAAIELIESEYRRWGEEYEITDVLCDLGDLPTAEPEIIKCNDCLMHGVCRFEQGLGLDGYCSQAERRSDEHTYKGHGDAGEL